MAEETFKRHLVNDHIKAFERAVSRAAIKLNVQTEELFSLGLH